MVVTQNMEDMKNALKAFQQAERSQSMKNNPDLHYNRASVST